MRTRWLWVLVSILLVICGITVWFGLPLLLGRTVSSTVTPSQAAETTSTPVVVEVTRIVVVTATPVAATATPPSVAVGTTSNKCEWLRNNFPQTDTGVQQYVVSLTGDTIPQRRVTIHKFQCGDGSEVYDGGIVNGPAEGWSESFSISVPYRGSVVDSYPGATFSGEHFALSSATERATSGMVTAVRATFWPWWDERPPLGQSIAPFVAPTQPTSAAAVVPTTAPACIDPEQLATQMGWTNLGWADKTYGGLRVQINQTSSLPVGWMAQGQDLNIGEYDANRVLPAGKVVTIYPPYGCREQLGFSK